MLVEETGPEPRPLSQSQPRARASSLHVPEPRARASSLYLWRAEATCLELCALVRPLWMALASRAMQGSQLLGELSPALCALEGALC